MGGSATLVVGGLTAAAVVGTAPAAVGLVPSVGSDPRGQRPRRELSNRPLRLTYPGARLPAVADGSLATLAVPKTVTASIKLTEVTDNLPRVTVEESTAGPLNLSSFRRNPLHRPSTRASGY